MKSEIQKYLPPDEILAHLAEEAAELSKAALKLRRSENNVDPTPKSHSECLEDMREEFGDVLNCLDAYFGEDGAEHFAESCRNKRSLKKSLWLSKLAQKYGYKKERRTTVRIDNVGIPRCTRCGQELLCNDCGDMPDHCPECKLYIDWNDISEERT
jgi:NTP pyrophosphatase (non-canonical NTP hydrolase)